MKQPELNIGDRCWYYINAMISFVDVTASHKYLEGTENEFCLYDVREVIYARLVGVTVHRGQLFKCPEERQVLIQELRKDLRRLREYAEELRAQDDDYVPDPEKEDV